jgi:hypothetical protein
MHRAPLDARGRDMPRLIAAALLLLAASPAVAEVGCAPYCDFWHYYGPYDYTYVRPGLYAYPACRADGDCSPYLVTSRRYVGRVTVRLPRPVRPHY